MELTCPDFQAEIIEIAESGVRYTKSLSLHLSSCDRCREFLLEQLGVNALLPKPIGTSQSRLVEVSGGSERTDSDGRRRSSDFGTTGSARTITGFEVSRWIISAGVISSYVIAAVSITLSISSTTSPIYGRYLAALAGLLPALLVTVIAVASYLTEKVAQVRYAIVGLGGALLGLNGLFSMQARLPLTALIDYLPIVVTFSAFAYRDHIIYRAQVKRSLELFDVNRGRSADFALMIGASGKGAVGKMATSFRSGYVLRPILVLTIVLGLLVEVGMATATPTSKSLIFSTPVSKTLPMVTIHKSCSGSKSMQL
ncbi:MAG: hypothetical protein M0019_10070 [Actinomycetota bacterium]|nr:hypothetical protein [Actinomycetota bacterium]